MVKIEREFERMDDEKKREFIDAINCALRNCHNGTPSKVNEEHKDFKKFLKDNVRDDEEVVDNNIEYWDIRCPMEFLDTQAIIESDNDYDFLIDDWHLNVFWIFECNYDDLIENGVLIEL